MRHRYKDLTGQRFGRLAIVSFTGKDKHNRATWLCHCDCGNQTIATGSNLTHGYTKSCGCLFTELNKGLTVDNGKTTRLYHVYTGMKDRCFNPNNKKFNRYGGRGITICPEWMDFEPFRDWALANEYRDNLTIERINNDNGYFPENCRWATRQEQALNRSFTSARSGVRGVSWHQATGKWYARVIRDRKVAYAEFFDNLDDAAREVKKQRTLIFNQ